MFILTIDWGVIFTNIILFIVGSALTILFSYATAWVNSKIKDEKLRNILSGALNIVTEGVDFVYQTYVQGLKGTDLWDENAMNTANQKALDYIKNNLSSDMIKYLEANGKDIDEWAHEQIEIVLRKAKEKSQNTNN